eukprot:124247-Amphidinium_carterae.1
MANSQSRLSSAASGSTDACRVVQGGVAPAHLFLCAFQDKSSERQRLSISLLWSGFLFANPAGTCA